MGNWVVVIEGVGTHDTPENHNSIEEQVAEFVKGLREQSVTEVLVASGSAMHRAVKAEGHGGPSAQGRYAPAGMYPGSPGYCLGPVIGDWGPPARST
jgi:hypothetical protein